jgi:hypothetical protein
MSVISSGTANVSTQIRLGAVNMVLGQDEKVGLKILKSMYKGRTQID